MIPKVIKTLDTGAVAPLQKSVLHPQAWYVVLEVLLVCFENPLQSPPMYCREQSLTTSENTQYK